MNQFIATNDAATRPAICDLWTHDPEYRCRFQSEDEVVAILKLLALPPVVGTMTDVGCGNGRFVVAAARQNPGCEIWAFDAMESAVAECKLAAAALHNVRVQQAWADALPLPASSVDRVLFRSVLHHIPDPQPVLAEFSRVLKSGGRLVLQAPCNKWEPEFGDVLSELMWLADNSHRRKFFSPDEIHRSLDLAGLTVEHTECWPYEFSYIDDGQACLIRQHKAEERLRLRPIGPGQWAIEGSWVRVVALLR